MLRSWTSWLPAIAVLSLSACGTSVEDDLAPSEGELQASEKLMQAAEMLSRQDGAMQLRYMQTLGSIANDKTTTIVFPLPVDLLGGMAKGGRKDQES